MSQLPLPGSEILTKGIPLPLPTGAQSDVLAALSTHTVTGVFNLFYF
ncbi:rCG46457, isoform CRA_a [Rattus norvegicus]|uniref:RCG46457, isoform CRA_a n=1 Tax=Rattus norvegicus TaxID=10116 RepID=A6ICQ9_RAT|nr:rCG46457, isoform CRA_a [Rattus norvegicus]